MQKFVMHKFYRYLGLFLVLFGLLAGVVRADTVTYHLTDKTTISGEIVTIDERGMVLREADGTYSDHIPWTKFSQDDLKDLQDNPKAAQFVQPFIEVSQEEKTAKTEIDIKSYDHLDKSDNRSLIHGMLGSGIGIFILFVLYAGNIYAGYEVSLFRGRPAPLVIGLSAVLPVIAPIIVAAVPRKFEKKGDKVRLEAHPTEADIAPVESHEEMAAETEAQPAAPVLPPTKTYVRGQYIFNRRFFETQMPGFFGVMRSEADRDMVLTFKTMRGTHVVQRISRISPTELHLEVHKGNASQDVTVPFTEVQEVEIKHKDAP